MPGLKTQMLLWNQIMPESCETLWLGDQTLGLLWDAEHTKLPFFLIPSTTSRFISLCMSEMAELLEVFVLILLKKLMNENMGKWRQILYSSVKISTEFTEIFAEVRTKQELLCLEDTHW